MPDIAMSDAVARRRIREELGTNFFVEAAAGTGKTTELVNRILAIVHSSDVVRLDRVVAITFTEKAAGELKLRLRTEIERSRAAHARLTSGSEEANPRGERAAGSERARRLERALDHLELARIGTIHSFCTDLLRERPLQAGIDPLFEVAGEEEAACILERAFSLWFERILDDPPPGIRRVLHQGNDPRGRLRSAVANLVISRDFQGRWSRPEGFDRAPRMDEVLHSFREIAALAERAYRPDHWLAQNLHQIRLRLEENEAWERVHGRDPDVLEARLREWHNDRSISWHWKGGGQWFGRNLPRQVVLERRDAARADLEAFVADADADLAATLQLELREAVTAYEKLKRAEGKLDFTDLLLCTRNLVRDNDAVRQELQARFTHFLVDEFQDTDPLQIDILLLLSADDPRQRDPNRAQPRPGALFLVGDPKQSIYRFRRADVALYERVKRRLLDRGAQLLNLSTSFRSAPAIQQAVNAAFEPLMQGAEDGSQAEYVALEPWRADTRDRPALVALPVPQPYADSAWAPRITKKAIDASLPNAIGAFLYWLVHESGWTVTERENAGVRVPIRPRHIALLFRKLKDSYRDVARPFVEALEIRGLPHMLVGGRWFHDRDEVLALRNALVAIEWPDDALRVYATLRGPLFGFTDDVLLAYRAAFGIPNPLRRSQTTWIDGAADELEQVISALDLLRQLHLGRNRRPISATLLRLLTQVRAHAVLASGWAGEQALANALRVVDRARSFEQRGAPSFRSFVELLEEEAESGDAQEAVIMEEGTEGVRMLTVHKAKGLEFPVVVLADFTSNATLQRPSRYVDPERGIWAERICGADPLDLLRNVAGEQGKEHAEAVRLAYVAATRARDLLVLPTLGEGADTLSGLWTDPLRPAFYPAADDRRVREAAAGCPPFGEDTVLARPAGASAGPENAVAPGQHRPQRGDHRVVWWDPGMLQLEREAPVGPREQALAALATAGEPASAGLAAYEDWRAARNAQIEHGSQPLLRIRRVTERSPDAADGLPDQQMEVVDVRRQGAARPSGSRFGTLVHTTLATVDLSLAADLAAGQEHAEAHLRAIALSQARLVGAPASETAGAVEAARGALLSPVLQRVARSPDVRRECPILLPVADGELVEGVLDLAFLEIGPDGSQLWTVVDYKTGADVDSASYRDQLTQYARAVAQAAGCETRAVLMLL